MQAWICYLCFIGKANCKPQSGWVLAANSLGYSMLFEGLSAV